MSKVERGIEAPDDLGFHHAERVAVVIRGDGHADVVGDPR